MTVEIKPGPELDAAIAQACGIDGEVMPLLYSDGSMRPTFYRRRSTEDISVILVTFGQHWQPSTDLNAAFEAAEKIGLFHNVDVKLSKNHHAGWTVEEVSFVAEREGRKGTLPAEIQYSDIGTGPTEALAICAAILKRKP